MFAVIKLTMQGGRRFSIQLCSNAQEAKDAFQGFVRDMHACYYAVYDEESPFDIAQYNISDSVVPRLRACLHEYRSSEYVWIVEVPGHDGDVDFDAGDNFLDEFDDKCVTLGNDEILWTRGKDG